MEVTAVLPIDWVKATKYEELTGHTVGQVRHLRRSGVWLEGRQWKFGPDGKVWVHMKRAQKWVEGSRSAPTKAELKQSA